VTRERALIVLQAAFSLVTLSIVTWLVAGGVRPLAALSTEAPLAIALAAALLVLGFFNVYLPRGDAVDTTAAVAFAAGALLHPVLAAFVITLARSATVIAKPRGQTAWAFIEYVGRRVLLVALTFAMFGPDFLTSLGSDRLGLLPVRVVLAAVGFMVLDTVLAQVHVSLRYRAPYLPVLLGTARLQGWMLAAEMSVGALTVLLFQPVQYWGLVVTVGLLLVMRQSFALLLEVRSSYTSTVEALARSIEAYDPDRRGHAERVSQMVGEAGRMLGLQGKRLEDLTYAALFHDVGLLGVDDTDEVSALRSSEVLSNVGFLAGAVPILSVLDDAADGASSLDESDLVGAYMIAHFSALDSELHLGSHERADLTDLVGARLYSTTRRGVDRALRRVEREVREDTVPVSGVADVDK
jgi:hypothetical protein